MLLEVKLDQFEGPMDLLLYLIKREEVDIYDIPIAKITEQYLNYLDEMKKDRISLAGEFFVMAATLIRIKTQMLLPRIQDDERANIEDPRSELVLQLLEYQHFKELAEEMHQIARRRGEVFYRTFYPELETLLKEKFVSLDINQFMRAFQQMANRMQTQPDYEIELEQRSVEFKIEEVWTCLQKNNHVRFSYLYRPGDARDLVLGFVAILEMARQQRLHLIQNQNFDEIWVEKVAS